MPAPWVYHLEEAVYSQSALKSRFRFTYCSRKWRLESDTGSVTSEVGETERRRTTEGDPSLHRHPGHHQIEDITTDVVEVHIGKPGGDDLFLEIRSLVIDRNVDPNLFLEPFDFIVGTSDGDDFEAHDFSNLTGDRTDGAGGTRDEESLASLDLANVDQALNVFTGINICNRKYVWG